MNGAGLFFLLLLLLVILPALGWAFYVRWTAHRNGLPAPPLSAYNPFSHRNSSQPAYPIAPRPGGIVGWMRDKFQALKTSRMSGGGGGGSGLGGTGDGRAARGQFRSLDPDGAWDDRVGHEADAYGHLAGAGYEEQELGLHPPGHYGGSGYGEASTVLPEYGQEAPERGRSRNRGDAPGYIGGGQRGLDQRYDEEMHGGESGANPFDDEAESSDLRGVSPRPVELDGEAEHGKGVKDLGSGSMKSERKSMFQEDMHD